MPPLIHDEESETEMPRKRAKNAKSHAETNVEADVHAKDQLKDELMDDIEANEGTKAAEEEKTRVSPTASNADEEEEDDSDEDDEEKYEVEAIIGHEFRGRGKGKAQILLYNVKWKGYDDSENTLEPEENLISSRDLLAKYHHSIGGYPQPETASAKKKKRSKSNANESAASATEASPVPPPSKRQKQNNINTEDGDSEVDEANFGSWMPKTTNWDSEIKTIETVERDQASSDLYILLLFKNGKKSRVKNALMRKRAPQSLLNFYEAHLSV